MTIGRGFWVAPFYYGGRKLPNYLRTDTFREGLHLGTSVDENLDDAVLSVLLDAAEVYIGDPYNGILRRPVARTEFTEEFPDFPDVSLRFPDDAGSVVITYTDEGGEPHALSEGFTLSDGCLSLLTGNEWPGHIGPVTVEYVAGYYIVPAAITAAGYFYAGTLYEAQFNAQNMNPETLRRLMAQMLAGYRRAEI